MAFLAAENENRQLEDLPQADFGRVHKNVSFVDKEKVNNWFCEKKVTPIVFFCNGLRGSIAQESVFIQPADR